MRNYNPEIHHRHSVRLKGYDYSQQGAYFVTVCTQHKECIFGAIKDNVIHLNECGKIVEKELLITEQVRNYAEIDEYVIMPNHVHIILILNGNVGARRCLAPERLEHTEKNVNRNRKIITNYANPGATHRVAPTKLKPHTVSAIIGQFKSIVTKQTNNFRETSGIPVWQRNYYDHIIRNEDELNQIREYIVNNPLRWDDDENNPINCEDIKPASGHINQTTTRLSR
jgi:REP element-mobilizing transposase RayT